MKKLGSFLARTGVLVCVLAVLLWNLAPALAQAPSSMPPYNVDTGVALITNVGQVGSATVNSANQTNLDKSGAVCTAFQTAISGTPSWTFSIQGFDAATATWNTLVTSGAITTSLTNINTVRIGPGLIAADVPANGVGTSIRLPRVWRVQEVFGAGSGGPTVTAKIGCNLLK